MLLTVLERYEEAVPLYEKGLDREPRVPGHWFNLGHCYRELGQDEKALAAFSEFIERAPKDPNGYHARATVARRLSRFDLYLSDGARAWELGFRSPSFANELAFMYANVADEKLRDGNRAIRLARYAVGQEPMAGCWHTLGTALYRAGKWDKALVALGKSMELRSGGNALDFLFVAMAKQKLGEADAREWYERGVAWMDEHNSDDDDLRRFRAEAEEALGIEAN
jgi:predicted Zn-dependent protease